MINFFLIFSVLDIRFNHGNYPIIIDIYIVFDDKYKAFEFEKYLKSGSGRAFTKKHFYKNFVVEIYKPMAHINVEIKARCNEYDRIRDII